MKHLDTTSDFRERGARKSSHLLKRKCAHDHNNGWHNLSNHVPTGDDNNRITCRLTKSAPTTSTTLTTVYLTILRFTLPIDNSGVYATRNRRGRTASTVFHADLTRPRQVRRTTSDCVVGDPTCLTSEDSSFPLPALPVSFVQNLDMLPPNLPDEV